MVSILLVGGLLFVMVGLVWVWVTPRLGWLFRGVGSMMLGMVLRCR